MDSGIILASLYLLAAIQIGMYVAHLLKTPMNWDRPRFEVSLITKSWRYAQWIILVGALASFPVAIFVLSIPLPGPARWGGGLMLGGASLGLLWWSLAVLGENFAAPFEGLEPVRVVRHGPYRFLGHPIYVANFFLYASYNIVLFNWPLIVLTVLAGGFYIVMSFEESRAVKRSRKGERQTPPVRTEKVAM